MTLSNKTSAVILAAGSSSRLGRPKQLVRFRKKTLLQHVIDIVTPFEFSSSVLVLGAYSDDILNVVSTETINVVINEDWPEGIASSIRAGIEESLKLNPQLENIMFLLSDQPFVSTQLIEELIKRHAETDQKITASSYNDNVGVPAIFPKFFFPKLKKLKGDRGAKKIIVQHPEEVTILHFELGHLDVDTPEDYEALLYIKSIDQIQP